MATPDFVVIGHIVRDLVPGGWRLGGTSTFAAVQALRLGYRPGVVTRTSSSLDIAALPPDIEITGRPSKMTTCFENLYDGSNRTQRVPEQADPISLDDVPETWRSAPLILLGAVCAEVPPNLADELRAATVGSSAQGWLREIDPGTRGVRRRAWNGEPFWRGARAVFASEEDLEADPHQVEVWAADVPIVAVTRAGYGARVAIEGAWYTIDAFPAGETDPTGAGDVFATAFLIRYHETRDPADAARFACAAASCSVEGAATERIAGRGEIEDRMKEHPEIMLR